MTTEERACYQLCVEIAAHLNHHAHELVPGVRDVVVNALREAEARGRAEEREACAQLADGHTSILFGGKQASAILAAAIRARGEARP